MTGLAVLALLFLLGGGRPRTPEEEEEAEEEKAKGELEKAHLLIPNGEPDWQPGPIDVKPVVPNDTKWLADVQALVSDAPRQERFFQIVQGITAADIARTLLVGPANTNANRVRLIKCLNKGWNLNLYGSTGGQQTWGDLYDDSEGRNQSSAFMPRHASAIQSIANRHYPERNISAEGQKLGPGGYYGLWWIPKFTATANAFICNDANINPPAWFLDELASA